MINNPKLINKIISQIRSLTYEEITEVIRKVDMEEDIKILKDYCYAMVTISSATDKDIEISKRIENVINRLEEDEEVIKLMTEFMNKRSWKEHQLKDEDCHCCKVEYGSDECAGCIDSYFREKVKNTIKI